MDTFEHDLEMLKYYQQEFEYRNTHFWNTAIKLFLLTLAVTILPIVSTVFGVQLKEIANKGLLYAFPFLGLIIAVFSCFILDNEAKRLSAVNTAKYRINNECFPEKYHYHFYNKDILKEEGSERKNWLSHIISFLLPITNFLMIICVVVFIGVLY